MQILLYPPPPPHPLPLFNLKSSPPTPSQVNSIVFQTIYERGDNASDLETLVTVAAEVGLSPADARAFLISPEGKDAVIQEDSYAKTELDVRSVPYFVIASSKKKTKQKNTGDVGGNAMSGSDVAGNAIAGDGDKGDGRGVASSGGSESGSGNGNGDCIADPSKIVLNGAVSPYELLRAFNFASSKS